VLVAVLGTGTMGGPMARNIAGAGLDVRVWNRNRERAEETGLEVADSPAAAVDGADVMLTMLSDGDAVEDVAGEALDGLGDDAVWLQMSTVGVAATEKLAALADGRGVAFVDAPVSGTKEPAEKGELVVIASGPQEARERVRPIFDAVGAKTVDLGEAGEAQRFKLVMNAWLAGLLGALAETIAFAGAIDIDPKAFLNAIDGAPMGTPYAQLKGKMMVEDEFPTSFSLDLVRKDAGLVLEAAERHGFDAKLVKTLAGVFDEAIAAGHGDEDMAAAIHAYRR
jgi:3-hydroxyisobutyrate dehydrogenase